MRTIAINRCCDVGLQIVLDRDRAWEKHQDAESVRLRIVEAQHMASCPTCNPDLRVNAMLRALWPSAKVSE